MGHNTNTYSNRVGKIDRKASGNTKQWRYYLFVRSFVARVEVGPAYLPRRRLKLKMNTYRYKVPVSEKIFFAEIDIIL